MLAQHLANAELATEMVILFLYTKTVILEPNYFAGPELPVLHFRFEYLALVKVPDAYLII